MLTTDDDRDDVYAANIYEADPLLIPAEFLVGIAEPIAVRVEDEALLGRGIVPGDCLILDAAATPQEGEIVVVENYRPAPGAVPVPIAPGHRVMMLPCTVPYAACGILRRRSGVDARWWELYAALPGYPRTVAFDSRHAPLVGVFRHLWPLGDRETTHGSAYDWAGYDFATHGR